MIEFTYVTTEDQSPTVRIGTGESQSEAMHSLKGAFSETVYIYGTAIETAFDKGFQPRVLSLGLGLGYVELLAAGLALKKAAPLDASESENFLRSFGGESFELIQELRDWFRGWLLQEGDVPQDFRTIYDSILERTAQHTGASSESIRALLSQCIRDERWQIREALSAETAFDETFGCICFDAFSSKTSPELWTEPFLLEFFAKVCAPGCVLSTYACTGALKRSLRTSGFDLQIREGFSSKRDSTFAVRVPTESP